MCWLGTGPDIDDMVIALKALIGAGVPKVRPGLLQHRDDFLAAPRGGAAHHEPGGTGMDDLAAKPRISLGIAPGVAAFRPEFEGVLPGFVDFSNRRHGAKKSFPSQRGVGARGRKQHPDRDRLVASAHFALSPIEKAPRHDAWPRLGVRPKCPQQPDFDHDGQNGADESSDRLLNNCTGFAGCSEYVQMQCRRFPGSRFSPVG